MSYFQRTKLDNATGTTINPATSDLQTSGAQKTQIVDGSGNVISSLSNHLSVAAKLIDEAGVAYGVKHVNNKPRVSAMPYLYDIAEGNVANHEHYEALAYTPTLTTTESTVWGKAGLYVFPASPIQMQVVSSSANDAAAGTGCRTIKIGYLDDTYAAQAETVTLTGTVPVLTTATNILRINSFRVITAGTLAAAAGNIQLQAVGGATTYRYLSAGFTRARNGAGTVPLGKAIFIVRVRLGYGYSSNSTHYARMFFRASQNDGVLTPGIFYPVADAIIANATVDLDLVTPFKMVEKADWTINGTGTISGIGSGSIRGWLETA